MFVTACSMDEYAEEKRTEKNLIVRSDISEAETTNNKDCARRFVLKLYRHKASRGLFATAELLVLLEIITDDCYEAHLHILNNKQLMQ